MIRMALHQSSYDLRAFLRNRQSQFFTLALPVLFLVIFASLFGGGHHTEPVAGGRIAASVYYVPGIIALGVIAAAFGNLVASVTAQRERGVLKRRRATPAPAAAIIVGRVLTAVIIAVVMATVLLGIGWAAYGAHVPGRTACALAVTVVIGAASFCCMGAKPGQPFNAITGGKSWPQNSRPRPSDVPPTERSRRHEKSRRWDSPSSSSAPGGPSPSDAHSSARSAEPRSKLTKPCRARAGASMRVLPDRPREVPGAWIARRHGPRLLPLALLALFAALLVPGGGWLLFVFFKLVLVFWLVSCLAGILAACRSHRRMHVGGGARAARPGMHPGEGA
jgi:ABC-type transport system involved in cytochrome c biogenesis permease component